MSRLYPARPFLAASAAVIRDGRILLAARANPPAAHVFSLPGGLVEPGETLAEAALRELHEEVGIRAEIVGFLAPVEVVEREPDGRVRRHFVVCAHLARWVSGEPTTGAEALALRWIGLDDLDALAREGGIRTTPDLVSILRQAFAMATRPLTVS